MQTQEQYYSSTSNYGEYQYVDVGNVIDGLTLEIEGDQDHYLKGMPRYLLLRYAIDGVRELNFGSGGDILGLELEVGDDLQFILPQDFVDYIAVYVVGDDKKLYILDYNASMNTAGSYLQDHDYNIVFDSNGDVIDVDGNNVYQYPYDRLYYGGDYYRSSYCGHARYWRDFPRARNYDTSKFSKHGDFVIDKQRGVISLSSNLLGKSIVIRYISDGLQNKNIDGESISVHKYLIDPLQDYIYYRGVERKRNVPANEKIRANRAYKTSRHKANIKMGDFAPHRIAKAMRSIFKPIKT